MNANPLGHERHITFAVKQENDSNESNHTVVVMNEDDSGGAPDGCATSGFNRRLNENSFYISCISCLF